MTRIVKAAAIAVLSASLAVLGLPLAGGPVASVASTGCCKA